MATAAPRPAHTPAAKRPTKCWPRCKACRPRRTRMKDDARPAAIAAARKLLAGVRGAFDAGTLALAHVCARDGKLDNRKLDQQQVASFELAWAGADLLASETALEAVAADATALEVSLALLFAADAVASVLDKLETVYLESGQPLASLRELRACAEWDLLRAAGSGARALESTGRAVAASDGEVGPVALDDQHALAQDSFRRFAADVVAPQAEHIHREDATVPESL